MSGYYQLTLEERCSIARLHEDGQSIRQIAAALDRSASTISRGLKRNSGHTIGDRPVHAQERAAARRLSGSRLERDHALREAVLLDRLAAGWSPEQIAGRMTHDAGHAVISHVSIYRFVYAQIRRTQDFSWRLYLPRGKSKRGWRRKPGGLPASLITGRKPLCERPGEAEDRCTPGPARTHEPGKPQNPHLRQRRRVRPTPPPQQPTRYRNLLLRHPQPMAKRRRRKRHRAFATQLASQNQHRLPIQKQHRRHR